MNKRSLFRMLVLFCVVLCCLSSFSYGVFTSDLAVVPHGVLPEQGNVEFGVESKVFELDNQLKQNQGNFFLKVGLSDRLETQWRVSNDFDHLFGFSALVFEKTLGPTRHGYSFGYRNLGWNLSETELNSLPVVRGYHVYSVSIPRWRAHYHIGVADFHMLDFTMVYFGVHHNFNTVTTSAEWDGKQVHFGARFKISDDLDFYTLLTPSPFEEFGNLFHYVSFAFSRTSNPFNFLKKEHEKTARIEKKYDEILHKMAILDSKTDVVREFNSVDFLEEFEQFLLNEHLVEKELEEESKETIKTALEHMQRGLELYYSEHYELALQEYQFVTTLVPRFSIGFARLGSVYYKLGDLEKARLNWEKALALNPSNDALKMFLKRVVPPRLGTELLDSEILQSEQGDQAGEGEQGIDGTSEKQTSVERILETDTL
ncbi:hypothetical protein DID78_01455 [Candidatus Marinamargulisbacteria bacterium SCGC AG-343-D04]|nr:hypothetical protein DID78_01455 [Candidatus Marinamargulisbacteria bacterium SCGC AG-343-D04]